MVLIITMHRRRNHGGSGGWSPPLFSKVTLCLHIRSLPTELEPPFIKPCSYAFGDSDQYFNYHRFEYIHYLRWSEARKICINSTVYPSYPLLLCIRSLLLLVIAEKGVEERSYMPQEREWWIIFFSLR